MLSSKSALVGSTWCSVFFLAAMGAAGAGCSSSSDGSVVGSKVGADAGKAHPGQSSGDASTDHPGSDDSDAGEPGGDDASAPIGCGLTSIEPTCDTCLQTSCCDSASACAKDPDCSALVDCLATAPLTDGGVDACNQTAGDKAQGEYAAFQACMTSTCSVSCGSCHGTGPLCSGQLSASECDQAGCDWATQCTGSSYGCYGLSEYACISQQGCYYNSSSSTCSGVSTSCSLLTASGCTYQQGCFTQMKCTGVSTVSCSTMTTQTACAAAGCSWY